MTCILQSFLQFESLTHHIRLRRTRTEFPRTRQSCKNLHKLTSACSQSYLPLDMSILKTICDIFSAALCIPTVYWSHIHSIEIAQRIKCREFCVRIFFFILRFYFCFTAAVQNVQYTQRKPSLSSSPSLSISLA